MFVAHFSVQTNNEKSAEHLKNEITFNAELFAMEQTIIALNMVALIATSMAQICHNTS